MPMKAAERFFLDQFILAERWDVLEVTERESPDFLVRMVDGRVIGVEVTSAFRDRTARGSPSRTSEVHRNDFINRVVTDYYARGGPPADVHASFNGALGPNDASRVVDLLLANVPDIPWQEVDFELPSERWPEVTFRVRRLPDDAGPYRRWIVVDNQVDWALRIDAEFFSAILRDKATRLSVYRLVAEEIVLLIHIEGTRGSGFIHLENEPKRLVSNEGFDAVHLYKYPDGVHRLA